MELPLGTQTPTLAAQWAAAAVGLAVALILFFDWVHTPLNRNIEGASTRDRLIGDVIHVTIGAVIVTANLLVWRWITIGGAVWYTFVLGTAILNWWVPWLSGFTRGEITPDVYERDYARNLTVLPDLGRSVIVPDVQHALIHLAVLAACIACWVSARTGVR